MNKIIAAISDLEALDIALKSNIDIIFLLSPNINTLPEAISLAHENGKKIYIHMDMAEGLGRDKFGIKFAKDLGVDGIISTRANIIKSAKESGLLTVQRFFIIDAHSIITTIETAKSAKPDMIEIMPGIAPKVIDKLKTKISVPIIAGGLIETEDEIMSIINAGASAISTSQQSLWK